MCKICDWAKKDLDIAYHNEFWGVPQKDDAILFEMLILDGMQAGLSWSTILVRREGMRRAFDNFDYKKIAQYDEKKEQKLLTNPEIIRNRAKVAALKINAKAFMAVQDEFGSFAKYFWSFVNNKPVQNKFEKLSNIPATTSISDKMSKDMKKRGFKFCGSTICYAYMQATGLVNDHMTWCKEYKKCMELGENFKIG